MTASNIETPNSSHLCHQAWQAMIHSCCFSYNPSRCCFAATWIGLSLVFCAHGLLKQLGLICCRYGKKKTTLTWLLKVLVCHFPGISDFQQTGFHSPQIHLGAITLRVVHGALAPAVIVPAHKLALLITADVAESCLHKPGPQVLWQYGLKTYSEDKNKTKTQACHTDVWRGRSKYFSYCRKCVYGSCLSDL